MRRRTPTPDSKTAPAAESDYDRLLHANLERVFNERDAGRRAEALNELFVAESVMYEPTDVVRGRDAIAAVAGKLLDQFGPTFRSRPSARLLGITAWGPCGRRPGRTAARWRSPAPMSPKSSTAASAAFGFCLIPSKTEVGRWWWLRRHEPDAVRTERYARPSHCWYRTPRTKLAPQSPAARALFLGPIRQPSFSFASQCVQMSGRADRRDPPASEGAARRAPSSPF